MFAYIVVLALAASIDIVVCTNGENDCGIDSFTCGDGACVSWESYCDGVQHCADNSDEEGCSQRSNKLDPIPEMVLHRNKRQSTHGSNGSCVLPDYPEHGTYTVNGVPGARPGQSYPSAYLTVTCDPGYDVVGSNYTYCFSGIGWRSIPYCSRTSECGTPTPDGMPLVVNGTQARRGELPWHAGIYSKSHRPFMQICGGSLVTSTLVISAAHCFWKAGRLAPASRYAVALGKMYRLWDDPMDEDAQKSDVSSIEISEYYLDVATHFRNDIALVFLSTTVNFTFYIRPICIDFDIKFDKKQLRPGNLGKISGWGLTSQDRKPSPLLLTTELPFVPVSQCIADVPVEFRAYITSDKICAGTMNETAVCQGDSGGGLAFPTVDDKGTTRYYLRGVVSTAPRPRTEHACNVNSYTTFTHIQTHDFFIRGHLFYY